MWRSLFFCKVVGLIVCMALVLRLTNLYADRVSSLIGKFETNKGICVIVASHDESLPIQLARQSQWIVYVHSNSESYVHRVRQAALEDKLLGTRIYVESDSNGHIALADNLADALIVNDPIVDEVELLRVLQPGAAAVFDHRTLVKPIPDGDDQWNHPYHGPDNNPQSLDANAKPPYLTQFLSEPWYVPMPQVTVTSGGRIFKAFGHIALKEREWPWLNTLVVQNAYNGTQLWRRDLNPGFMIHRSTIVATPDLVYLADDISCKLLDAANGELRDEIVIPAEVDVDGVWKWMALKDGVLYALIGAKEQNDPVIRGQRKKAGWPWSDLGKRYGGSYQWGFGRTLVAMNPLTKEVRWTYRSDVPIDSRAMCLSEGRIYVYSHMQYLAALDVETGGQLWKTTDPEILQAIGEHDQAQTASKGFASSAYVKANDRGVYFAGPQRTKMVAVSAQDGSMLWSYPHGNFQLVLRDDALYAMGRMETSKKFDYLTGSVLADLQCYRGNCTRATATRNSIFTRGYRHTGTMQLDVASNEPHRIPLMRPACQDGVIVSNGMLYWGPWMCDCNHSLVGMISLAAAGELDLTRPATTEDRLESFNETPVSSLPAQKEDWSAYRHDVSRSGYIPVQIGSYAGRRWQLSTTSEAGLTAPILVAGTAYWSGLDGIVRAADIESGQLRWNAFTGGSVRFPPEYWQGRIYVGSGDGWIYCFDAFNGQRLWRFRAAPTERRIPVHGRIISNWPVGSGVLVQDGVLYAAAGITSYDGTYVFALDAKSGAIRWQNNQSGRLVADDQVTGISVQGHLLLHQDQLYMAGGNVVSPAIYDLESGHCLNDLDDQWLDRPAGSTERFPANPGREMFKRSPRGRELFVIDGQVRVFDQLLYSPQEYGPSRYFGNHFLQVGVEPVVIRATQGRIVQLSGETTEEGKPKGVWEVNLFRDAQALALCKDAVIVAGELNQDQGKEPSFGITALGLENGSVLWSQPLPAKPVLWGLAVSRDGHIVVTLIDGTIVCF